MNVKMPDISLFQSYQHRHNPFAKYDYMCVLPFLGTLNKFLTRCQSLRDSGVKLPKRYIDSEMKAYIAIQENKYVTTEYQWENYPTDCWNTTTETWWQDFLKQKKIWERNDA